MKVRLLLFAALRDLVGFDEQDVELPAGATALDLWELLRREHEGLLPFRKPPMTAVNQRYVPAETSLSEGDEVAFIPPVSGGH